LRTQAVTLKTLCTLLVLAPAIAAADRVTVPLSLERAFLESVLREQAFTGAGESVRINDDGTGCQFLELRRPSLAITGEQLRIRTHAQARAGRKVAGNCLLLVNWHGQLELDQTPGVTADGKTIVLRTTGWRALKPDDSPDSLSTTVGQWLNGYLPAGLRETRIDVARPIAELEGVLSAMLGTEAAAGTGSLLQSVRVDSAVAADDRVTVTLGIDVAAAPPAPSQAEPVLTEAELAQLSARLDDVDAFFTYTIRSLTTDESTQQELMSLLEVLVELRHDLIDILASRERQARDPARTLFIEAWEGITPLLQLAARARQDQAEALRYLTFLSAGDALGALDQLGPASGIEVSSDGLRRMARILIPEDQQDPLDIGVGVDPALRQAFGFGPPVPAPRYAPEDAFWLEWLIPSAVAASSLNPKVADRLNNWVPKTADMTEYLPMAREVLNHVIAEQLRTNALAGEFHPVYRRLVFTAAWQESCWRQFVARDQKRVPVESGTGDVGMMQINPRVWRGFYDLQGLRWDIVYNARAGADILQHHLANYAIAKNEHRTTGSLDNLARATYAAYNGGPRQYDRYRRSGVPAQARKIDQLFHEKYVAVAKQGEMAVRACYGG
jgi:hypothetical protein